MFEETREELHSSSTSPPRDMIVEKGSEVLLSCKSSIQVEDCQWSWKDLYDDGKVDVKSFHSFGDDHHDCSVRFNNILSDQQGVWSCAARSKNDTHFVTITEVRLAVLPSHLVQFMEEPSDTEVIIGNTCTLTCKTMDPTSNCLWTWRPSGAPQEKDRVIQEISPNGQSNDCSLLLNDVSKEQDGLWTCGARVKLYQNYTMTHSVKLTVVNTPLKFIELPGDSKVTVDTSKTLTCILSTSVEECRWQWKSEDSNNSNFVLVEQFTPMDKMKRDCRITLDKIKIEQEGYWICGARRRGDVKFIDALPSHLHIYTVTLPVFGPYGLEHRVISGTCTRGQPPWPEYQVRRLKVCDSPLDLTLLQPSAKGIEFVQLSQNIQKAIGEPVQMHCRINKAVEECQWTWKPINETIKTPEVKRRFQPAGDERRDCSIRLKMLLQEEEGIWTCGVRLHKNSSFTEASPTTVTLFPPIRLRFMEQPENIRVALGKPALLRCVATAAVEECRWTWRPLTEPDKEEVLVKQFLPFGSHNRNCSVRFLSVQQTQEGLWGCTAIGHPNSSLQSTPLAKLEVFQPVEIKFIENSQDIHIAAGGHIKLHCTTSSYVDMCRWTWEPIHPSSINVAPTIKQEFPATGKDGRNCSYRLEKVETEDEGIWVCSVRGQGMEEFVQAPPTKLLLVKSGTPHCCNFRQNSPFNPFRKNANKGKK
uniref:Ig-like domain-containing protein n=1 Tax=Timema bartmani TaxID=61472 RepID=A0A7R9F5Y0_9NEOP|nr:unnamed protein product [Timema bartmani]